MLLQLRVLLVEDDLGMLCLLNDILVAEGFEVEPVCDSVLALSKFRSAAYSFDLVITDLVMPGLTGKELVNELRRLRLDIPVILCSGHGKEVDLGEYWEQGATGFVSKPINLAVLRTRIKLLLTPAYFAPT